jgi:hypothetical protein
MLSAYDLCHQDTGHLGWRDIMLPTRTIAEFLLMFQLLDLKLACVFFNFKEAGLP